MEHGCSDVYLPGWSDSINSLCKKTCGNCKDSAKVSCKISKKFYVKLLQFNVQDPLKAAAAHILALADLSADPCEDFHQFACGNMSSATIPPGKVH